MSGIFSNVRLYSAGWDAKIKKSVTRQHTVKECIKEEIWRAGMY